MSKNKIHGRKSEVSVPLVESPSFLQNSIPDAARNPIAHNRFMFVRRLLQVARLWRTMLAEGLRETTPEQSGWQTLFWLSLSGTTSTQRELAERVGIRESTLARALDALERQGLVRRDVVKNNRRAKTITLTAEAAPVLENINARARKLREDILSDVDPKDMEACLRVLTSVHDALARRRDTA